MTISKECAEIGEKLLNSREILQTALDMAAHAKRPEDVVSSGLAKIMIDDAKELAREAELPKEEGMRLEVSFASALDSINKADYDTAISHILTARGGLLDLMFQKVVTCECKKPKEVFEKCPRCGGTGVWPPGTQQSCDLCGGTGLVPRR